MTGRKFVAISCGLLISVFALSCDGGRDTGTTSPPSPQATITATLAPAITPPPAQPQILDLASKEPLLTIFGADEGDLRSDHPALAAGDFNSDGVDDILVGARFADGADNSREDAGEAYVIFGSRQPSPTVDIAAGQQDFTVLGARLGDNLGFSVAAADINSDGIDDILLGALFAGPAREPSTRPGAVYIIFGRESLPAQLDLAASQPDVTIFDPIDGAFFGDSLASGDVNGDGLPDLIVGAPFETHTPSGAASVPAGAAHVFLGRADWPMGMIAGRDSDAVIFGAEAFDEVGDFVISADINGDGLYDVIITAEAADGPDNGRPLAAEVYVLYGSRSIQGTYRIAAGEQDLSLVGADQHDTLGFTMAAGDLNGDGIDDLVIGARLASGPGNMIPQAGEVYILYGSPDLPSFIDLREAPDYVAAYYGEDPGDLLGSAIEVADLDGDGLSELLLGAGFADGPDNSRDAAGDLHVLDAGQARGQSSLQASNLLLTIFGPVPGGRFGAAVAVGDIDGDGALEILTIAMDAPGPNGSRPGAGRIYAVAPGLYR